MAVKVLIKNVIIIIRKEKGKKMVQESIREKGGEREREKIKENWQVFFYVCVWNEERKVWDDDGGHDECTISDT